MALRPYRAGWLWQWLRKRQNDVYTKVHQQSKMGEGRRMLSDRRGFPRAHTISRQFNEQSRIHDSVTTDIVRCRIRRLCAVLFHWVPEVFNLTITCQSIVSVSSSFSMGAVARRAGSLVIKMRHRFICGTTWFGLDRFHSSGQGGRSIR